MNNKTQKFTFMPWNKLLFRAPLPEEIFFIERAYNDIRKKYKEKAIYFFILSVIFYVFSLVSSLSFGMIIVALLSIFNPGSCVFIVFGFYNVYNYCTVNRNNIGVLCGRALNKYSFIEGGSTMYGKLEISILINGSNISTNIICTKEEYEKTYIGADMIIVNVDKLPIAYIVR